MHSFRPRLAGIGLVAILVLSACASPASPSATPTPPGSASATPSVRPTVSAGDPSGSLDPTPSVAPTDAPTATPGVGATYVVQPGDNLYRIGLRFGVSVAQLQAWNVDRYPQLANPDALQAGWVLVVSADPNATPIPTSKPTTTPATPKPSTPSTASCRAGNRVAAGSMQTFDRIPTGGKAMAITLDMGGRLDPALDILNYLIANKVCTTIFATGAMAQTPTGQQILAVVRAHPELFEVGNHTMHHCDLVTGEQSAGSPYCPTTRPSGTFVVKELTDAAGIIRDFTQQNPQPYWRAPFGASDAGVRAAAASAGYTKTIQWSIDTIDWSAATTSDLILSRVLSKASSGAIVLMHLGGYHTADALPTLIQALRQRGYTLTTLSDMLD